VSLGHIVCSVKPSRFSYLQARPLQPLTNLRTAHCTATVVLELNMPPRVLACVLCQQRKVRCDRQSPCMLDTSIYPSIDPSIQSPQSHHRISSDTCQMLVHLTSTFNCLCHEGSNCIKAQTECVPATLQPRRKRRRFPESELLERLRRYEDLLRQNGVSIEPLLHPTGSKSSATQSPHDGHDASDSDGDYEKVRKRSTPSLDKPSPDNKPSPAGTENSGASRK
jgi:hypothetical protein